MKADINTYLTLAQKILEVAKVILVEEPKPKKRPKPKKEKSK